MLALGALESFSAATLFDRFDDLADRSPQDLAVDGPGFRCTRRELQERAHGYAAALLDAGLGRGDRIAVWLPNGLEWIALLLAASRSGMTIVALNMRYKSEEASFILRHSGASMLFMAARSGKTDYLEMLRSIVPDLGESGAVASAGFPALRRLMLLSRDDRMPSIGTLRDAPWTTPAPPASRAASANDALVVLYTSGTTSAPKGVMVRESSLLANAAFLNEWMELRAGDRVLLLSPFCGIYGLNALIGALVQGATAIISETTDPEATLDLVEAERVTAIGGTLDAILRPWAGSQKARPRDLSRIRDRIVPVAWMQGDPTAEMPAVEDALGIRLVHTYGLSEATAMSLLGNPAETAAQRHGGRLVPINPAVEVKVAPVAANDPDNPERGELCLRGPLIMSGYLDDPEATTAAIDRDGWLHTGDFAFSFPDGAVRYDGRIKDIVKISGYSVSPAEIEHFLSAHPDVSEVQVIGIPGEGGSDRIAALVIPKPGASVDRDSIAAYCDGRIATFKIPTVVRSVSAFPIAPSANADKVQKNFLREMLIKDLGGA